MSQNLLVFLTYFFLTYLYPFISFCFLHTYLIVLSWFASLYNHLFIYLLRIHSDEELLFETSVSIVYFCSIVFLQKLNSSLLFFLYLYHSFYESIRRNYITAQFSDVMINISTQVSLNKVNRVDWLGNDDFLCYMFLFFFSVLKYDVDRAQITKGLWDVNEQTTNRLLKHHT